MKTFHTKKLRYYLKSIVRNAIPRRYLAQQLEHLCMSLNEKELSFIKERVDYYNQLNAPFTLNQDAVREEDFHLKNNPSFYYFDLKEYTRYFPKQFRFNYLFGDITHVPENPTIVKSRPIHGNNQNAIVMKLDKLRHFHFVDDALAFEDKKDLAVFRGPCYQPHRLDFIQRCFHLPTCDFGDTNLAQKGTRFFKPFMSIEEQLTYKFIISVEGNDVATNLKWIMSSNSVCMMKQPVYETWFMEGRLKPNCHYVLLKDDYSDLEQKIHYYLQHPDQAQAIVKQANQYVQQFMDLKREKLISLLVLKKYFEVSQQL